MRGITLITADGVRHNILVALAGSGISISRDTQGRLVIDASGGEGGGDPTPIALDDLTDVVIVDPQEGDILRYDEDANVFTNVPASAASDPASDTRVWMPLTTVVGGVPQLVFDADGSVIPTLVPI